MTPDELNKEIARLKGWKPPGHPETEAARRTPRGLTHSTYDTYWLSPGPSGELESGYPNYAGEWEHCGPLLEEMVDADAATIVTKAQPSNPDNPCRFLVLPKRGDARSLMGYIAAAYYEWQKGKR